MSSATLQDDCEEVAALVAIARAARTSGDRQLERLARRELAEVYGVNLKFGPPSDRRPRGATSAAPVDGRQPRQGIPP